MPQTEQVTAMQNPTRREWLGILLAPLAAAASAAAALHFLSQPSTRTVGTATHVSSGVEGWAFSDTFPQLLPTFIAFSFVYHLTILPYIRSHNRRSALMLTALAPPVYAVSIFALILFFVALAGEGLRAAFSRLLWALANFSSHSRDLGWFLFLAGIAAVFIVFVVIAALAGQRCEKTIGISGNKPAIGRASRGWALSILVLLPLLYTWVTEYKKGSDRAACILNIRNVQQATRSHNGMNGISTGPAPGFSKNSLIGPGNFISKEPVCPAGGTYIWIEEGRSPQIGELMMRCSIPHHNPEDHHDW